MRFQERLRKLRNVLVRGFLFRSFHFDIPGANATAKEISEVIENMTEEEKKILVEEIDFETAREKLTPSISLDELERYKSLREKFS